MAAGLPDPERLARLTALSRSINGKNAPPPIDAPVVLNGEGQVLLPVPDHAAPAVIDNRGLGVLFERKQVWVTLHAGMTLQWAPVPERDGLLIEFRGGEPDGDADRDAVAVFLTRAGLHALVADLTAIEARL